MAELLKIRVEPVYGWGWFRGPGTAAIDVPSAFDMDIEIVTPDPIFPFRAALGQCTSHGHLLDGMWIVLNVRSTDGACNLRAFNTRPKLPHLNLDDGGKWSEFDPAAELTGFAYIKKN
jgi:hypothetical protein